MPTWQEACTPYTQTEAVAAELAALAAAGSNLNGWGPDAPQMALVQVEAEALVQNSQNIAALAKTASPTTVQQAGPSWVDAEMGWFDITRLPATYAVFSITLIYEVNSPFTIDATNAGTIQAMSTTGKVYLCTQASPVQFTALNLYQNNVLFTARDVGEAGNVTPALITKLISGPAGLQVFLQGEGGTPSLVTAPRNAETDAAFIARGLGRWGVILGNPNGTAGWVHNSFNYLIPYFSATVTRWTVDDANPLGPGTVLITLANETGPATTQEVTDVTTGLNGLAVKPVGSGALTVQTATLHALTVTVTVLTDGSNADVQTNLEDALTNLGNAFPLGPAVLDHDLLVEVIMGARITSAAITTGSTTTTITPTNIPGFTSVINIVSLSPAGDATLAAGEVLVITPVVTVT